MFRRGADFVDAAIDMLVANERVNGEFYTCPVYNYMIKKGAKIGIYEIAPEQMHGLGTPDDLIEYLSFFGLPNSKTCRNEYNYSTSRSGFHISFW